MTIKNIFFDFDGVILESVNVKTDAFYKMYIKYGKNIAHRVVTHHHKYGGISRFEKIRYYHKEFLNIDLDDDEFNNLVEKFSNLVVEGVIRSPFVSGVKSFIESEYNNYRMSIISGTPESELRSIVKAIGMNEFFCEIHGSPVSKTDWVNQIIMENNLIKDETLFIGDALTDWNAALDTGIAFLLRETEECIDYFKDFEGMRIKNFVNIKKALKEY